MALSFRIDFFIDWDATIIRASSANSKCLFRQLGDFLWHKKTSTIVKAFDTCDPEGIRTPDPQIRNLLLYPTELRDH